MVTRGGLGPDRLGPGWEEGQAPPAFAFLCWWVRPELIAEPAFFRSLVVSCVQAKRNGTEQLALARLVDRLRRGCLQAAAWLCAAVHVSQPLRACVQWRVSIELVQINYNSGEQVPVERHARSSIMPAGPEPDPSSGRSASGIYC